MAREIKESVPAQSRSVPAPVGVDRKHLEARYGLLVNRKYEHGLEPEEERELQELFHELSALDEPFYEPVIDKLRERVEAKSHVE